MAIFTTRIKLFLLFILIPSICYGAAIQGREEGSSIGYCKSLDFAGASQTLSISGLDCTLTSTAGDSGITSLTGLSDVGSDTQGAGRLLISDGSDFQSIAMSGSCTMAGTGVITCAGGGSLTGLSDVGSSTLTAGRLLIADGSDFDSIAMSGDVTIDSAGVTAIQTGVVGADELAATSVAAGDYTGATVSVDADGRVTYAATGLLTGFSDVGSNTQGAGRILISDGVDFQSAAMSGDLTVDADGVVSVQSGVIGSDELAATSVSAGDYTGATISVDADGRVTYAQTGLLTGFSDVGSNTQGAGRLLISDGTDFQSIAVSGEATIDGSGVVKLGNRTGSFTQSGGDVTFSGTVFHIDSTNTFVGIGTTAPTSILEVNGTMTMSGTGNPGITPGGEEIDPCTVESEGHLFYNSVDHLWCYCDDSGDDIRIVDNSTPCF